MIHQYAFSLVFVAKILWLILVLSPIIIGSYSNERKQAQTLAAALFGILWLYFLTTPVVHVDLGLHFSGYTFLILPIGLILGFFLMSQLHRPG